MTDRRWAGKEFVELMTILSLDLMESYERIQTDPFYQPARRTWVRTFCSQLEAFVYSTKQMVAGFAEFPFINLTEDDLAYLREVPRADEKRPRFLPLNMVVTDDELKVVTRAQDWFHALTQDLWTKIDRSLKGLE